MIRRISLIILATTLLGACASSGPGHASTPRWTFEPSMIFPSDRSLSRPEDGVALPDGRLLVSDRAFGLRIVDKDGSSRPFGDMRRAGYQDSPPQHSGAANGVTLEPSGTHVLVADILGGGIYRVAIANGATERIYQHPFGVNCARRDSSGAIWFTQSTQNTPEQGEARMFAAADVPIADGALWHLPVRAGKPAERAEVVREGLFFPNGIALDERRGVLFLSELGRDRVLRARLDVAQGRASEWSTLLEIPLPDNLELDDRGRLWVALPVRNEVGIVDTLTGAFHSVFRQQSATQVEMAAEFVRRGKVATPRIELLAPALWEPLPGPVTGMIVGAADGSVYLTGLGDALIRLER